MSKSLILSAFLCTVACSSMNAQLTVHRSNEIPVIIDQNNLPHAWAGGINSSQWSTIDLNLDGILDLFIYDRSSRQFHTFLNNPNSGQYELTFDYHEAFPEMRYWVLLRDFNCDGKMDIFTSVPGGIKVFENTSEGSLAFDVRVELLDSYYDFGDAPYYSSLYVSTVDIPSIDDFDGDGDLDIHTFTLAGQTIEYHKNMAVEMGNCDSLAFELANRCYGMLGEDAVSPTIYIGEDYVNGEFCTFNVPDPHDFDGGENLAGSRHSGSSICTFDYDGNGQRDLLIGDITARDLALVYLEDREVLPDSAIILETGWPALDQPIDLHVFHTGFFIDVDNDGIKDVIAAPTNGTESEDLASCYFYKNTGSNDDVDVALQQTDFIQSDMLDFGTVSMPRILDYNNDGLLDLIVSNRGKYQDGGLYEEKVHLFRNVGEATYPIYELVTDNAFGLNDLGFSDHLGLSFADIDGDDDLDMVVGDGGGKLHLFTNQADPGAAVDFDLNYYTLLESGGEILDLGASIVPQFFDLDEDGLQDIIAGERNGNINYLKNQGTASNPDFVLYEDSLGSLVTDFDNNLIGYSAPWLYRDANGDTHGIIGSESGELIYIDEISADTLLVWDYSEEGAFGVFNGQRSCPVMNDIDADGLPDIINGNHSGGLGLYMAGDTPSSTPEWSSGIELFSIFPNPAKDELNIKARPGLAIAELRILDLTGRLVGQDRANLSAEHRMNTSTLRSGTYLIVISGPGYTSSIPFIKR